MRFSIYGQFDAEGEDEARDIVSSWQLPEGATVQVTGTPEPPASFMVTYSQDAAEVTPTNPAPPPNEVPLAPPAPVEVDPVDG